VHENFKETKDFKHMLDNCDKVVIMLPNTPAALAVFQEIS